jgi:hypothetical protein
MEAVYSLETSLNIYQSTRIQVSTFTSLKLAPVEYATHVASGLEPLLSI